MSRSRRGGRRCTGGDDGDLLALRVDEWKVAFKEQENLGFGVWEKEFTNLRVPAIYNIRSEPFERGPESFEEVPQRQKPASSSLDQVMRTMTETKGPGQ